MNAGVAELVDALDLGSSAVRRGGSSPSTRTSIVNWVFLKQLLLILNRFLVIKIS